MVQTVNYETGHNLTGPVAAPPTGDFGTYGLAVAPKPVALSAGPHTLKWV